MSPRDKMKLPPSVKLAVAVPLYISPRSLIAVIGCETEPQAVRARSEKMAASDLIKTTPLRGPLALSHASFSKTRSSCRNLALHAMKFVNLTAKTSAMPSVIRNVFNRLGHR